MEQRTTRPLTKSALPASVLAVLYVAVVVTPLAGGALLGVEPAGHWNEIATAAGIVGAAMLFLQLVSSGRFETLSGRVGIDVTMALHKWAARLLVVILLLHPLLYLGPLERVDVAVHHLTAMLRSPRYLSGVVALALVVAVTVLAILRDRLPVPYEAWRASHGLMALAATWATIEHLLHVGTYSSHLALASYWLVLALAATAAALGVYVVRAWRMARQGWRITGLRHLAERLWEIKVESKTGERLGFAAGQFAWLALSPRRFPLFDHPFSIASNPHDTKLAFIVQEAGDFTDAIGKVPIGAAVGLDAPHGSFTLEHIQADAILLVAGGVGVAPIFSLLADLAAAGDRRPVRLVYGARSPAAMIDPDEFRPFLDQLDARATFLVDAPTAGWPHDVGAVSKDRLEEALAGLAPAGVAAMICGPSPMMCTVTDALCTLGVRLRNIQYERFDYSTGPSSRKDIRIKTGFRIVALVIFAAAVAFALR